MFSYVQSEQSNQKQLEKISKEINDIEEGLNHQERIILENQSKTINIEDAINNINEALLDMGIADFKIEKYSDSLYKLSREGQTGDVFRSLSEGEKMIISLLYFIERCKGKESKDDIESKKIVVIDDPISSLSHIYVYNVGRLLLQEFTDANPNNKNTTKYDQVFLLTHSLYFFYEMAITKRKDKEDGYNQKLFRIQKNQQGSYIFEMKYSEIQNDYHALSYDAYNELKNDKTNQLTTGDVADETIANGMRGTIVNIYDDKAIVVLFDIDEKLIVYSPDKYNNLSLAYVINFHKSQGAGIKNVICLITPLHKRVLSRNLLYVGQTRAKESLIEILDEYTYKKALTMFRDTYDVYPGNLDEETCMRYAEFSQLNTNPLVRGAWDFPFL